MALQDALSALLLAGPSHGYQLMATLESELGPLWETRASRVYLTLAHMEREGLVTSTRVRQDNNRPDRRLLQLTRRGRSIAQRWLEGKGATEDAVVRLAVARLVIPREFDRLVTVLTTDCSARLKRLRELRRQTGLGFQPEALGAEIARTQADLRWLALVRDRSGEIVSRPKIHNKHASSTSERAG
jgi:DNA-binding PadR family transcriptional regulator